MRPLSAESRISIVLGGGWILGGSFHAGVLLALEDRWGVDPRAVRTIVGTSAGAVTAGLITAGVSARDLFSRETGDQLSHASVAILSRAEPQRPVIGPPLPASPLPAAPGVALRAAAGRRPVAPGAILAGMLPRGNRSHLTLRRYFDRLHGARWPNGPQLRLCAVELNSGRRVVVDDTSSTTPGQAIAASCALPGWHQPVPVDGRDLIDGALHSVDNADTLATGESDLVIVSSPLSTEEMLGWRQPLSHIRNAIRLQTSNELRQVERSSRLVAIQPSRLDIQAMGRNLNDRDRRAKVARQAYNTASALFEAHQGRLTPAE